MNYRVWYNWSRCWCWCWWLLSIYPHWQHTFPSRTPFLWRGPDVPVTGSCPGIEGTTCPKITHWQSSDPCLATNTHGLVYLLTLGVVLHRPLSFGGALLWLLLLSPCLSIILYPSAALKVNPGFALAEQAFLELCLFTKIVSKLQSFLTFQSFHPTTFPHLLQFVTECLQ